MLRISWVAAQFAASQEGLGSVSEWVRVWDFSVEENLKKACNFLIVIPIKMQNNMTAARSVYLILGMTAENSDWLELGCEFLCLIRNFHVFEPVWDAETFSFAFGFSIQLKRTSRIHDILFHRVAKH
jgi:hypothetical protein